MKSEGKATSTVNTTTVTVYCYCSSEYARTYMQLVTETSHYSTCKIPEFTFQKPSERPHVKIAAMTALP